jgi:hypothetical protein
VGTWIEARFYQGYPSRRYIHRFRRFRNHPTRFEPPLPSEYPAILLSLRARGHSNTVTSQFKSADFVVSDAPAISIGLHGFAFDDDRSIHVRAQGIELKFVPQIGLGVPPVAFQLPAAAGETHCWLLADALCDVTGMMEIDGSSSRFAGLGFFDQQFGSGPALHLKNYSFRNNASLIFPPSIEVGESADVSAYAPGEGSEIAYHEKR